MVPGVCTVHRLVLTPTVTTLEPHAALCPTIKFLLVAKRQVARSETSEGLWSSKVSGLKSFSRVGLLYKGSVFFHERKSVINPRAKSGGFHDLRYTRIESTSADCSARLADDIDTEGVRVAQQAGIPGEVRNLDQDVPWMLTVTFHIGRRPT